MAVGIAGFCTFLNLYPPQAILPALAADFAVPLADTGITLTATLLSVAAVAPFVGSISDRLGRKRLILAACFILAVPTLLIPLSGTLAMMTWLRFAQGLLLPFIFAVTVAYIGDEAPGSDGIALAGAYSLGSILGGFGGRFLTGEAADLVGWRAGFVLLGAITLASAGAIATLLPMERRFRPVMGGFGATLATYREHLSNPRMLATCAVGFCMLFSMVASFTYVNFRLALPPFNLDEAQLGLVFTVYLLGLVTNLPAARLAQRIGRRKTLVLAAFIAMAGSLLTLGGLWLVIAGLALLAGALFVVQTLSLSFIGVVVPRARSTAVGLYVTVYYVGGAVGAVLPAPLWQSAGWPGVVGLVVGATALIAGLGTMFWREAPVFTVG